MSVCIGGAPVFDKNGSLRPRRAAVATAKKDGGTALMAASHRGHLELVQTLIAARAALDKQDDEGAAALMGAAHYLPAVGTPLLIKPFHRPHPTPRHLLCCPLATNPHAVSLHLLEELHLALRRRKPGDLLLDVDGVLSFRSGNVLLNYTLGLFWRFGWLPGM